MLEKEVKKKVRAILKKEGIWYFCPVPSGWGDKSVPDFICCINGEFLAIETKRGTNPEDCEAGLTELQKNTREEILKANGNYALINGGNLTELWRLIDRLL